MVGNVFFTIIPSQKALVKARKFTSTTLVELQQQSWMEQSGGVTLEFIYHFNLDDHLSKNFI